MFLAVFPQAGQTQICPFLASNPALKASHFGSDEAAAPIVTEKYITWTAAAGILLPVDWASEYIQRLKAGQTVQFRPRGWSMNPAVPDNALCTVEPVDYKALKAGDIVLCVVKDKQFLHYVKAVQGLQFQIGNARGFINGWVSPGMVYGKLTKVEP